MKKKFTEAQIVFALRQAESGTPIAEIIRKMEISEVTFYRWKKKYAGIGHVRFHDLRHMFATNLVMNGVDLVTVKEILGHSDISMTVRYSHPSDERKMAAVECILGHDVVNSSSPVCGADGHNLVTIPDSAKSGQGVTH
jgi:integrase